MRRALLLVILTTLGFGVSASAERTVKDYPLLNVMNTSHGLGQADDPTFSADFLSTRSDDASILFFVPPGFTASLSKSVGANLGIAQVGLQARGSGHVTRYFGSVRVLARAAFAADPNTTTCAPGNHRAVWSLDVGSGAKRLSIPVAIDLTHGAYAFTLCFGAAGALGRKVGYFSLAPLHVFHNPTKAGVYRFSSVVTPYAADGTPNSAAAYELRAYDILPQTVDAAAAYDASTKKLTVTGTATAGNSPNSSHRVAVYASSTNPAGLWANLGDTVTGSDGTYSFSRAFARLSYKFVFVQVETFRAPSCPTASPLPGGCASGSVDGTSSEAVAVKTS